MATTTCSTAHVALVLASRGSASLKAVCNVSHSRTPLLSLLNACSFFLAFFFFCSVAAVYGAVATPSELTIVTDLVKRGPLRAILDDRGKRDSLMASTRHRIIKVWTGANGWTVGGGGGVEGLTKMECRVLLCRSRCYIH